MSDKAVEGTAVEVKRPQCGDCRFFDPDKHSPDKYGYCRKNAPIVTPHGMTNPGSDQYSAWASWPYVSVTDWCGEHHPAEDSE